MCMREGNSPLLEEWRRCVLKCVRMGVSGGVWIWRVRWWVKKWRYRVCFSEGVVMVWGNVKVLVERNWMISWKTVRDVSGRCSS